MVATERVGESAPPAVANGMATAPAAVLRHERLPFVSYPYEWTFSMLRDAAALQLRLLREALAEDLTLKDATPYNVGWRGTRPIFLDVGSFERYRAGEAWVGYRQFCQLFLYPLLLQAYRNLDFQPLLRGGLEGITPAQARAVLRGPVVLRRGVLTHVVLHNRLARSHAEEGGETRGELKRAGFRKELIEANVSRLQRLVGRLRWRPGETAWTGYGAAAPYEREDAERKAAFVRDATAARRWERAWDLGANDGTYSRIAADHADVVLAIDADHATVDGLYRDLRSKDNGTILPLVIDLADPSPPRGWRNRERLELVERGRPDLVLCLALVHHLSITGNVPLVEVVDWLAELGATTVVEFPSPDDPMVAKLLSRKQPDAHPDYSRDVFERALEESFDVRERAELAGGTRTLYLATPRS